MSYVFYKTSSFSSYCHDVHLSVDWAGMLAVSAAATCRLRAGSCQISLTKAHYDSKRKKIIPVKKTKYFKDTTTLTFHTGWEKNIYRKKQKKINLHIVCAHVNDSEVGWCCANSLTHPSGLRLPIFHDNLEIQKLSQTVYSLFHHHYPCKFT